MMKVVCDKDAQQLPVYSAIIIIVIIIISAK